MSGDIRERWLRLVLQLDDEHLDLLAKLAEAIADPLAKGSIDCDDVGETYKKVLHDERDVSTTYVHGQRKK